MAKKAESKKEFFEGYIKVCDRFYVKQCESHAVTYDVYELKDSSNKEKYPYGKMDDIAYGVTLERACLLAAHRVAAPISTDLQELGENLLQIEEEILENVRKIVK